jgi:hypothetical protein
MDSRGSETIATCEVLVDPSLNRKVDGDPYKADFTLNKLEA